jgi:hypothetical protein
MTLPRRDHHPLCSLFSTLCRHLTRLSVCLLDNKQFDISSDGCQDTVKLTKSFGWQAITSFLAHDVVEFAHVLDDKLKQLASVRHKGS